MKHLVPSSWRQSVDELRDGVMGLFDRWLAPFAGTGRDLTPSLRPWPLFSTGGPAVDVDETENEVVVTAELPGLSEKDFQVELQGDHLILRGEKKATREEKNRTYHYTECSYGSFYRAVPLPCEVNDAKADASYKHGVLTVRLPKTESSKARTVKVKVS